MTNRVLEHNVETGEVIERDMTVEEMKQLEADIQANEIRIAEQEAKAAARQAILNRLGLTEDEAKLLLG